MGKNVNSILQEKPIEITNSAGKVTGYQVGSLGRVPVNAVKNGQLDPSFLGSNSIINSGGENTTPSSTGKQQFIKSGTEVIDKKTGKRRIAFDTQKVGDQMGQFFSSDFEAMPVPGVGDIPNISQGTDDIRDENNLAASNIGERINGAGEGVGGVADTISRLEGIREGISTTTDEELKAIELAGAAAGAQFDPLIKEAQERRRTTLPSEVVRAGQRGGFESTQFAGAAAVAPTQARSGESFVGAGGRLDQTRQLLDKNVSSLRAAQLEAIDAAKAAERKAIQTGKREDFNDAVKMVELAEKLKQDVEDNLIKREQLFIQQQGLGLDFAKEQRIALEGQQQEARLQDRLQFDKDKFIVGEERLNRTQALAEAKFGQQVSEAERANTLDAIKSSADGRVFLEGFTDEEITNLEINAGLIPGTFEAFYSGLLRDAERGELIDDLKIQKSIADITRTKQLSSGGGGTRPTSKLGDAGAGLEGLSDKQRDALVPMIDALSGVKSREEALASLAEDSTTIRLQAGEQGLQILADEIDRRFPEQTTSQENDKEDGGGGEEIIDIESLFTQPGTSGGVQQPTQWKVDGKIINENSIPKNWNFADNGILLDENGKMVLDDKGLVVRK